MDTCQVQKWHSRSSSGVLSHDHDQSCTMIESTSLKESASETFDTITNSATTPKLTQVEVSSTCGHESGPPTLASSDGGVSASQGISTSKVLHIDCPAAVSSCTRSQSKLTSVRSRSWQ